MADPTIKAPHVSRMKSGLQAALRALKESGVENFEVAPDGGIYVVDADGVVIPLRVRRGFRYTRPEGSFVLGRAFPASEKLACSLCERRIDDAECMPFEVWHEGRPVCPSCAGKQAPMLRMARAMLATLVHVRGSVTHPALRAELLELIGKGGDVE